MPRWRAEYFDRANGHSPGQSIIIAAENEAVALEEIIAAENEAVALEEVRARMAPTCSRAEVTPVDPDLKEPV